MLHRTFFSVPHSIGGLTFNATPFAFGPRHSDQEGVSSAKPREGSPTNIEMAAVIKTARIIAYGGIDYPPLWCIVGLHG